MTHEKFLEVEQKVKEILEDCQGVDYGFDGENEIANDVFYADSALRRIMEIIKEL